MADQEFTVEDEIKGVDFTRPHVVILGAGAKESRNRSLRIRPGPAGVHLFNRVSGANLLLDEIKLSSDLWAKAPRQVSIALTNICDLACPYCYAPKTPDNLNFERLVEWLKELDANGCIGVGFGGGEPTLYRQFGKICSFAAQNTGLAVTFTTHAHWLRDELYSELIGQVHFIRVSVDGVGSTYEKLRGRSFEALYKSLRALRTVAPFGINCVVNADTLADLDKITDLAGEFGASEILLLPERPLLGRDGIDQATNRALRHWIGQYQGTIPLTISESNAEGFPICDPLAAETGLQAYAHITASGILKESSFATKGVTIREIGIIQALHDLKIYLSEKLP